MNKHALSILIFSSSILTLITIGTLSIDCNKFTNEVVSNECKSVMNGNIIFVSIVTIPCIIGSTYYLIPIKKAQQKIGDVKE